MAKTVVIIGSADTKAYQLRLLQGRIMARGHRTLLMDVGSGTPPPFKADIEPREIAALADHDIDQLIAEGDRFRNTEVMTQGAQKKMCELLEKQQVDGVVAMGGVTIALMGARVMHSLPFGMPKVIAAPAAVPVYLDRWFEASDIVVMQMILEIAGSNDVLSHSIGQVAGVISGMVEESKPYASLQFPRPSVAITEIGFSAKCSQQVERLLEARGFQVYTFHAQGTSERAMEKLISQGLMDGVIHIVPAGLIEQMFGGNRAGGMELLDAFAGRDIPLVFAPSCINLTGCGPTRKNREKYVSRPQMPMDGLRTMTRYNEDELKEAAPVYAAKLNKVKGPLRILAPLRGWSSYDKEGTPLYNPEQDRAFIEDLKKHLDPRISIACVDANLEDIQFAEALVTSFLEIFPEARS